MRKSKSKDISKQKRQASKVSGSGRKPVSARKGFDDQASSRKGGRSATSRMSTSRKAA